MLSEAVPVSPRPSPADRTRPIRLSYGFYEEQNEAHGRWSARDSALEFEPADAPRFLSFSVLSEFRDLTQELSVTIAN